MAKSYPGQLVFGLDIGTRSIVGTVGYKDNDRFVVIAQRVKEHETRSMLDGQIHDIGIVGNTIQKVKTELEKAVNRKLTEVCIAAAGRVLRTIHVHIDQEFPEEKEVSEEDVMALTTAGIEKAYGELNTQEEAGLKFYCVGFTVQKYYINDFAILNPKQHNAKKISADMIATFLPDDVVDGLYKAVGNAGLNVANLTLEPIAAIQVAIPQNYRMLNIALIDVGAGTSDICITKDGMIAAYGMIPNAGDSITEEIARQCLVDFDTAEIIKRGICAEESVEYKDIMGLPQKASRKEVLDAIHPAIEKMAVQAAEKIKELNGEQPVSAVFVVGGGGKILGYTDIVAETLGIPKERCAVRGEDVLNKVDFMEKQVVKDSLLVTPIGICLSFYEQSNRFIYVTFNNDRVKLYDNSHLAVVDAAVQASYDNEKLFARRGKDLVYYVDGKKKVVRGELGEPAVITVNGKPADLHTPIRKNDVIQVQESTAGAKAELPLAKIPDISSSIKVIVNDKPIILPAFAEVNGKLETEYYMLRDKDKVEIIHYYTIRQIAEFMDVKIDTEMNLYVNNKLADLDTKVYDNFSVIWTMETLQLSDVEDYSVPKSYAELANADVEENESVEDNANNEENEQEDFGQQTENKEQQETASEVPDMTVQASEKSGEAKVESAENPVDEKNVENVNGQGEQPVVESEKPTIKLSEEEEAKKKKVEMMIAAVNGDTVALQKAMEPTGPQIISVWVNQEVVTLEGKKEYIFVDVFDKINFDLSKPQGREIITNLNGRRAQFMEPIKTGDTIDIYWQK